MLAGLFLFLFFAPSSALGLDPNKKLSEYFHDSWQSKDGLPSSIIHAIAQTADGYIWLGTEVGLARFDGVQFTVFDKATYPQVADGYIVSLLALKSGGLLLTARGSDVPLLFRNGRITSLGCGHDSAAELGALPTIFEDRDETIWLIYRTGLKKITSNGCQNYPLTLSLKPSAQFSAAQDGEGSLWVGGETGLYRLKNGTFTRYMTQSVYALFLDSRGTLWIGTQSEIQELKGKTFVTLVRTKAGVDSICEDRDGNIWAVADGDGLYRLRDGKIEHFDEKQGLATNQNEALLVDAEGSLWIATAGRGLERFRDARVAFQTDHQARSFAEDDQGNLWIGSHGDGLRLFHNGKSLDFAQSKSLSHSLVYSLYEDDLHTLWVGTLERGLLHLVNGKMESYSVKNGLPGDVVFAMVQDTDGSLWVSTNGGIRILQHGRFTAIPGQSALTLKCALAFHKDRAGNIWAVCAQDIWQFRHGKLLLHKKLEGLPSSSALVSIFEDHDGTFWFGSYQAGVWRYKDGHFISYTAKNGMSDDSVYSIVEDNNGNLWMSSPHGVFTVSKDQMNAFALGQVSSVTSHPYNIGLGMKTLECVSGNPAGWRDHVGRLWFATVDGAAVIDPRRQNLNTLPPPVAVDQIRVDRKVITPESWSSITPGKGSLEIGYEGLSFVEPLKVHFKYKLENFDTDWIDAGSRRTAFYTNLSPGQYTFRVIAANSDGVWNQTGTLVHLYLRPHWYQTPYCWAASGLLLALALLSIHRLRLKRLEMQKRNLGELVEARTADLQLEVQGHQRTAQQLQLAKQAAEEASRVKSEFLANMSHEIRTPLNGVLGMTELTLGTELNDEQRDFLNTAYQSADTLLSVVNDILDFSKIEAGKMSVEKVPMDVCKVLEDSAKAFALAAHQKKLELACEIVPGTPRFILGDPTRVRQVIFNLIGNALKFTGHGEIVLRAFAAPGPNGQVLQVSVSDTGVGVPAEKQKLIFEAFSQADASTTRQYGGTGLGLTISTRLVELMGGQIWLESQSGEGSTFSFTIPLVVAGKMPDKAIILDSLGLQNTRVLIVDDCATNRQILERMLQHWHVRTASASDGQSALLALSQARIEGDPYKLILLDCHMPEMDGFELAERVRSSSQYAHPMIMMLTSEDITQAIARCRESKLDAYLVKPVKQADLLAVMRRLIIGGPESTQNTGAQDRNTSNNLPTRLHILLAEDNAVNQKLALRLLEKAGHTVTLAENGRQALELFAERHFDLILMDVEMPEMDGLSATKAIRHAEIAMHSHIPIVAMTAHALNGDQDRCLVAGMDGYISKPVNAALLMETIHHVIQLKPTETQIPDSLVNLHF